MAKRIPCLAFVGLLFLVLFAGLRGVLTRKRSSTPLTFYISESEMPRLIDLAKEGDKNASARIAEYYVLSKQSGRERELAVYWLKYLRGIGVIETDNGWIKHYEPLDTYPDPHASDLPDKQAALKVANYYIFINHDPERALSWLNYARSLEDSGNLIAESEVRIRTRSGTVSKICKEKLCLAGCADVFACHLGGFVFRGCFYY
jgi:hypothetical protein